MTRLILASFVLAAVHIAILYGEVSLAVAVLFSGLAIAPALNAARGRGRQRARSAGFAATLLLVAAAALLWPELDGRAALLAPPFLGYLLTSVVFGWSLLPGRVPVIVRMCQISRGIPLVKGLEAYARILTWGWTLLPAGLGIAALMVYGLFGLDAWSWVSNVANPIALATFFLGEHLYRAWRLPHLDKPSLARTFEVMLNPDLWRKPS